MQKAAEGWPAERLEKIRMKDRMVEHVRLYTKGIVELSPHTYAKAETVGSA